MYYCVVFIKKKRGAEMARKWTKQTAIEYVKRCREKGLTYWSAMDYLKKHKTMHSII